MKRYNVLVKIEQKCECGGIVYKWLPVSPTNGEPYKFTLQEAEKYVETYSFTNTKENFKIKEVVNNN